MRGKRILTDEEKNILLERTATFLKGRKRILFAYVFGSFLSSGKPFNDLDIGIFVSHEQSDLLRLELGIERELGDILHIPVDVRIINSAPLSFVYNVLKSGNVIVDKDKDQRADFEGAIYKKYFDFMHLRNEYLREVLNAAV